MILLDLGGDAVGDILSQGGGDRGTRHWPRWVAVLAVLVLATGLIVSRLSHVQHHPPARSGAGAAAVTVVPLPDQASGPDGVSGSAVNGAFSPDGKFLSLQVSFDNLGDDGALAMQLDVVSTASDHLVVGPAIRVSSDALVGFGWPVGGDDLVAELNFMAKLQVASWRPGAHRPVVAVISPLHGAGLNL